MSFYALPYQGGDYMNLILAVNHVEMHRFIAQNYKVNISGVAENTEELFELLTYIKADTIIISRHICSNNNHKKFIEQITTLRKDLRVIYLYGESDKDTEEFLRFLECKGIDDYHVGLSVSSIELDKLLFGKKIGQREVFLKQLFKRPDRTMWVKELDSAVITVYSNSSNGKSHLVWNLAVELASRGYKTTLINMDRGNSANMYFGIPDIYYDLLDYMIAEDNYRSLIDNCYKKGNLNVVSGHLGSENPIKTMDFLNIFNFARSKCDIVIIDTWTGLNEITLQAINNSNIDFFIFDSDLMHFHMNKLMMQQLGNAFIPEKTYAIINNCNYISESYKYIYKQIKKLNVEFKGVMPLSSCGSLGCDLMHTGRTPYNTANDFKNSLRNDMNNILKAVNAREGKNKSEQIFR